MPFAEVLLLRKKHFIFNISAYPAIKLNFLCSPATRVLRIASWKAWIFQPSSAKTTRRNGKCRNVPSCHLMLHPSLFFINKIKKKFHADLFVFFSGNLRNLKKAVQMWKKQFRNLRLKSKLVFILILLKFVNIILLFLQVLTLFLFNKIYTNKDNT